MFRLPNIISTKEKKIKKSSIFNFFNLSIIILALIASASAYFSRETLAGFIVGKSQTNLKSSINDGLVGYWTFDGGDVNDTTATDSANSFDLTRYDGVTSGQGPQFVAGKIGQGVSFDGVNDSYGTTNFGYLPALGTADFTMSAWVKTSASQTDTGILSKGCWGGGRAGGACLDHVSGLYAVFEVGGTTHRASFGDYADGDWHLLTGVRVGQYLYAYKDGQLVATHDSTSAIDLTYSTYTSVGARLQSNAGYYKGSIDDPRIYNRALSAKEIKELYAMGESKMNSSQTNLEVDINSGLVGYWTFDGADWSSSVTTTDKSNTAEHLGIFGGAKKDVGKIGQGIYFDGVSGRGATEVTSNTDYFTLSAWVYPEIVDGNYTIIAKNDASGGPPYLLRTSAGGIINFYTGDLADSSTDSTTALPLNQWTHVAGIYDGRNRDLYLNGVLNKHETTTGSVVINSTRPISIGTWTSGVSTWIQFWKGKLDDIRVYDRALSANEIYQLYMMGK